MAFSRYLPASIPRLVLVGFSLVAFPLLAALALAMIKVDGLARQSREAVVSAVYAVQSGRTLVEQATAMERSVRQYQVLGDASFFDRYLEQRSEFLQAAAALSALNPSAEQRGRLDQIEVDELKLHLALTSATTQSEIHEDLLARFPKLQEQARVILLEGSRMAAHEADAMQQNAARAQQLLFVLAVGLVPLTVLMSGLFTLVITRPLRQMDQAIRKLGAGEFGNRIEVQGPADLEELGARLEWLRLRLIELEQQKLTFLRHVSHDLKTPLAAIREGADLLNDQVLGRLSAEQSEVAGILRSNSLQLQRMIEDLLRFKAPREGGLGGQAVPVKPLIETVVDAHALALRSKGIRVHADLDDACVLGDSEQLRIIFDNLVSNAVKFSPDRGNISIRARATTERIWIDVRDEGPGIEPEERERVFEAFYQSRASSKGTVKGSGLGLAIVQEYVKVNQGSIEIVDSDEGAHFRVGLPLLRELLN